MEFVDKFYDFLEKEKDSVEIIAPWLLPPVAALIVCSGGFKALVWIMEQITFLPTR